jgi:pimeloyl-ACP methyl ester carboxylesterase
MVNFFLAFVLLFLPLNVWSQTAVAQERSIQRAQIHLWTETFGDPQHPAILLIMGAGASGIFWPDRFCENLSKGGYFVIRYDHRDVGKSSYVDYQKEPYTLDDLAQDALSVLDAYSIAKAHVVGLSMGGFIAQILAIKYPERFYSLVSMMSSPDHSVMLAALTGKSTEGYALPPPPKEALQTWDEMKCASTETKEERIALNLKNWKLCSGAKGFDEQEFRRREELNVERTQDFTAAFNHWPAMASWPNRLSSLAQVHIPTLVIHGGLDVVLPVEHGIATAQAIPGSTLVLISEMGHALCDFYADQLASLILLHYQTVK